MSYIEFFLAFLCPWIALGLILLFKRNEPIKAVMGGILVVSFLMTALCGQIVYFLTENNILIYEPSHSWSMWGSAPFEAYFGLFCQSFIAGLALFFLRPRIHPKLIPSRVLKLAGCFVLAMIVAVGIIMLDNPVSAHLGAVVSWSGCLLFLEWLGGSSLVWRTKAKFTVAVVVCAIYFSLVEGVAIRYGLWQVDVSQSLGLFLFNLPVERVLFHLGFCLVACHGLEIFWRYGQKTELFSPDDY